MSALAIYEQALKIRRELAITDEEIGEILLVKGDTHGALDSFRTGVTRFRTLTTENPENRLWQSDLGQTLKELGEAERKNGELGSGLVDLNEAFSIFSALTNRDPNNMFCQYMMALTRLSLGVLSASQKHWSEAIKQEEVAIETLRQLSKQDPSSISLIQGLAVADIRTGEAAEATGDIVKAEDRFREAYNLLEPLVKKQSPSREQIAQYARAAYRLGGILHSPPESRAILQKGRDALLMLEGKTSLGADDQATLTDIRNELNRSPNARGATN